VSVSATQYFVSGLRSFLRFCLVEGLMEADLSPAALAVTGRRRSSLPRGIGKADAAALLGACDRRSALGAARLRADHRAAAPGAAPP
jgi:integrase/recombinase XerD